MPIVIKYVQYLIFWFGVYYLVISLAGLFTKRCRRRHPPRMRFAIIVPAHNEEKVIGKLVKNLVCLDYPRQLYDIYVVADRCTDRTAEVARKGGAVVWERFDHRSCGKGRVLEYALSRLGFTRGQAHSYDAAVVFDADNLVSSNFLQVMNNRLLEGEKVIQSFIDSKNPNDSWVTSSFSITFWLNN
ncbi:MAG TPA: glycosyltransferase, partial [Firmicutes bacterium]|nr:glycosyltransferase [Bacillota bacterium]